MDVMENNFDPVREPSLSGRLALLGVVVGVMAVFPVYALLLGLNLTVTVFVLAPGAVAGLSAIVGIEVALRWEYRMRRRHTYPHELGCELAPIYQFPAACRRATKLIAHWLRARAVVVGWLTEDGQLLEPVAVHGLPSSWLKRAPSLSLGDGPLSGTLRRGKLLTMPSTAADSWFAGGERRERAGYIPLVAPGRLEGVLAIAAAGRNRPVRDQRLLAALGVVLGLALDNCRLYEGQRAHAQHMHELNRMKSDFLSTVSHELRTPLTSIMMAAEMLLEEEETRDPDSTRGRLVRNIVKGASRLSTLVSDLVNISRNDDFRPRLELDPVPVSDVLGNAVSIIQPLIAAKHQTMEINVNVA